MDAAPSTALTTKQRVTSIIGGSLGNAVEWFDWYIYAAFSLYFAGIFFPSGSQTAQLLNTAAVFALGFVMRPIGGFIMGAYADRNGRKSALTLSVTLMCLGSLIIACTPGYATIGVAAPVMLVVARLIQGLSVGGEYGTSATYLSEIATADRRGFYSSWQYVTLIAGQLLALATLLALRLVLSTAELEAWGWRIPFVIGAGLAVVAFYLRMRAVETENFTAHRERARRESPLTGLLRHPKAVLTVIGLTMGGTVAFYTYSIYMQKFLVNTVKMTKDDASLISAASLFIFMVLQPVVGALSDRIGRRPLLLTFGVLGTLGTVPMLTLVSTTTDPWMSFALITLALVIVSSYTAINSVVKAELFPAEVRALGVGFPYAIAVSLFGGTAEYIGLYFKNIGHETWFYWYVTGCIFCSLLVYLTMGDTRKSSLIDRD